MFNLFCFIFNSFPLWISSLVLDFTECLSLNNFGIGIVFYPSSTDCKETRRKKLVDTVWLLFPLLYALCCWVTASCHAILDICFFWTLKNQSSSTLSLCLLSKYFIYCTVLLRLRLFVFERFGLYAFRQSGFLLGVWDVHVSPRCFLFLFACLHLPRNVIFNPTHRGLLLWSVLISSFCAPWVTQTATGYMSANSTRP